MLKHLFLASLLAMPFALGCGGGAEAPTSVSEDDRKAIEEQEKKVEAEERAHQASQGK